MNYLKVLSGLLLVGNAMAGYIVTQGNGVLSPVASLLLGAFIAGASVAIAFLPSPKPAGPQEFP